MNIENNQVKWVATFAVAAWMLLACAPTEVDEGRDTSRRGLDGQPSGEGSPGGLGATPADPQAGGAGDGATVPISTPEDMVCAMGSAVVTRVVPKVTLVVDGSCSMSTIYPDVGGPSSVACTPNMTSRWFALREALLSPDNGVVTRLESVVEFGLVTFGTSPMCPLPVAAVDPALDNAAAIGAAYGMQPPGLLTPTGQALDWVYDNLVDPGLPLAEDPDGMKEVKAPHIIILATDGEPNSCDSQTTDYATPIAAAHKGAAMGATMHVISLAAAGGEFYDHLRQLANIGVGEDPMTGTATPYEPTTPEQLVSDLEALIGGAIGCDLILNGEVQAGQQCQGEVSLNGDKLGCDKPDGWTLAEPNVVRLQGEACETFKSTVDAQLDATFPCAIFVPE